MSLSDVSKSTFEKHEFTNAFFHSIALERHGKTLCLVTWRMTEAGTMVQNRATLHPSTARNLAESLLELATEAESESER